MENLQAINPKVFAYLNDIPKGKWTRYAFDAGCKADHVTNKMSKAWNNSIGVIRGQPIVKFFGEITTKVKTTIARRRAEAMAITSELLPLISEKLTKVREKVGRMKKTYCGNRKWKAKGCWEEFHC